MKIDGPFFKKNFILLKVNLLGSGCGTVDKAVAS